MTRATAFVELVDIDTLTRDIGAWRDLAARAAEPNVFAEPDFLTPALRWLAPKKLAILRVWSEASRERLIGLAVIQAPRLGLGLGRVWRSEQAGLAAAMFDRDAAEAAISALLALTAERGLAGLVFPFTLTQGPVAAALRGLAAREGRRIAEVSPRRRAALAVGGLADFEARLDRKRRKEWGRQFRRLGERGRLECDAGGDVDGFLALEARGWKGERGTSLNADPARLTFAREVLAGFAARGRMEPHRLSLDGASVAAGVVLISGDRGFYWKTAYDEAYAEYSPGVQITLALSRSLCERRAVAMLDSCALAEHPMIDKVWPDRIELAEFAVASRPGAARAMGFWLEGEALAAAARERVKQRVNAWLGRKRS